MSDHEMAGGVASARTLALAALKEMRNVAEIANTSADLADSGALEQAAELGATVDQGVQVVIAEALVAIALALTAPQTGKG